MKWDAELRLKKYAALQAEVILHSFNAEILVGESDVDAIVLWSGGSLTVPRTGQGRLLVQNRERGWFLCFSNTRRYRVAYPERISNICLAVLSLGYEDYDEERLSTIAEHFGLELIALNAWHQEEAEEITRSWQNAGWYSLTSSEESSAWTQFDTNFVLTCC